MILASDHRSVNPFFDIDKTIIVRGVMTPKGIMIRYTVESGGCEPATVMIDPESYAEGAKLDAMLLLKRITMIEQEQSAAGQRGAA